MKHLALLLLIGCTTPAQKPDASQAEEQAKLEGYLDGWTEAEKTAKAKPVTDTARVTVPGDNIVTGPATAALTLENSKPPEPVKWEDPDLQVVCWRAPEGISCLPSHTIKVKPRWK